VRTIVEFLKPTRLKAVFVVEWTLFVLLQLLRGRLQGARAMLVAGPPLLFFYLVGCGLAAVRRRTQQLGRGWRLPALAVGLALFDHLGKAAVSAWVPASTSVPVVPGWLHIAHARNLQGSWLLGTLNVPFVGTAVLAVMVAAALLGSVACHRYYVSTQRKSAWADAAFVGLFAGLLSWTGDMVLRGYVVDTISLPGVVAFDLKDILLTLGVAALVAETLANPGVSWRWRGWRREGRALVDLVARVGRFAVQEVRTTWPGRRHRSGDEPRR
jgi:lipoprotein signal peptidase